MEGFINALPQWLGDYMGYHHIPPNSTVLMPDHKDGVSGICMTLAPCLVYGAGPLTPGRVDPVTTQRIRRIAEDLEISRNVVQNTWDLPGSTRSTERLRALQDLSRRLFGVGDPRDRTSISHPERSYDFRREHFEALLNAGWKPPTGIRYHWTPRQEVSGHGGASTTSRARESDTKPSGDGDSDMEITK